MGVVAQEIGNDMFLVCRRVKFYEQSCGCGCFSPIRNLKKGRIRFPKKGRPLIPFSLRDWIQIRPSRKGRIRICFFWEKSDPDPDFSRFGSTSGFFFLRLASDTFFLRGSGSVFFTEGQIRISFFSRMGFSYFRDSDMDPVSFPPAPQPWL